MNIGVIFYSFSGNTRRAAEFLRDIFLFQKHKVDFVELKLLKEEKSFLKQCFSARRGEKPQISISFPDASGYDFLVLASPVWAFTFTPALRSYLNLVKNLEDKRIACFLTYGSGTGAGTALKELESILRDKGNHIQFSKNISGAKATDTAYLEAQFRDLIDIVNP